MSLFHARRQTQSEYIFLNFQQEVIRNELEDFCRVMNKSSESDSGEKTLVSDIHLGSNFVLLKTENFL